MKDTMYLKITQKTTKKFYMNKKPLKQINALIQDILNHFEMDSITLDYQEDNYFLSLAKFDSNKINVYVIFHTDQSIIYSNVMSVYSGIRKMIEDIISKRNVIISE